MRRPRPLVVAFVSAAAVWLWMAFTVHFNYGGNWTALFCTGALQPMAEPLRSGTYVFAGSTGYDGQWYRVVARDPLLRTDMWKTIDDPAWRYRRLLVPGLAHAMALGRPEWVDLAYVGVILASVFAGAWWMTLIAAGFGWSAWWGLTFVFLPGTLVSADRMTIDATLYALMAGALYAWGKQKWEWCWIFSAASVLVRETGVLLVLALAAASWFSGARRRSAALLSATLPAAIWYAWVQVTLSSAMQGASGTPSAVIPSWVMTQPAVGFLLALADPPHYQLPAPLELVTRALDRLALAGIGVAAALAVATVWRGRRDPRSWIALGGAGLLAASTSQIWGDAFSPPRAFTPLLAMIAWIGLERGRGWFTLPLGLSTLRVLWQLGPQGIGIVRGVLG